MPSIYDLFLVRSEKPCRETESVICEPPITASCIEEPYLSDVVASMIQEVQDYGHQTAEYHRRMMHRIPSVKVVDRAVYILKRARGKAILDVGCAGPLGVALRTAASRYYGIDVAENPGLPEHQYYKVDLDRAATLPGIAGIDLIIAGEVIEHLSNAGHFMDLLRATRHPVILTTVNAFSRIGVQHIRRGVENVNAEHVAYYSYQTFTTLARRHGFEIVSWAWYGGEVYTSEGLLFELE